MSSSPKLVVLVLVLFTILVSICTRGTILQPSPPGSCPCPQGQCCSKWGFCGTTDAYCGADCESQCPHPTPPPAPEPPSPLEPLINSTLFDELLLHRNDQACQSRGFYTYDAFITAARSFPTFGNTGDLETRKREIAAFLAQTSHQTAGGWPTAPDGPYTWGYCFNTDPDPLIWNYCLTSAAWPCVAGKLYYGRGPFQLIYNVLYGMAGDSLGYDLLGDPDALANDAVLSFKSALWVWMTPRYPKPSCHEVMTGQYRPTQADLNEGRLPGYGLTTFLTSGAFECSSVPQVAIESRIGFYKRYCDIFGVSYGDNLQCSSKSTFGFCGTQIPCPQGQCCSKFGFCGTTDAYCGGDCLSQCSPSSGTGTAYS